MSDRNQRETQALRYPRPKILLLDCEKSVGDLLSTNGFNVAVGTFGRPYKVKMDGGFQPVIAEPSLPNYAEQEVVVIDLKIQEYACGPEGEKVVAYSAKDWWCSTKHGVIDPRPRAMVQTTEAFDRLFYSGGVFIVFCEPRQEQEMLYASGNSYGRLDTTAEEINADNWAFLRVLFSDYINFKQEHGLEIRPAPESNFPHFFQRHLKDCRFSTVLEPLWLLREDSEDASFKSLLENKFGDSVGGIIFDKEKSGTVILLPHFKNKSEVIHDLIAHVLPDMLPQHFPFCERNRWLTAPEYEHPEVISLSQNQAAIRLRADAEIEAIEAEVTKERQRQSYLHGILTKTGDDLVKDVKFALEAIGFTNVVDVDENGGDANAKQEDLQVRDQNPVLLVEVKGLNGLPTEGDTLQVVKYIPRRMKEWGHTDVSGVVIINHQRSIPPIQRRNDCVFTATQIEDAKNSDIVLVTTWELFRLLRAKTAFSWKPEFLTGLFYGTGRISSIPLHWKEVGKVAHFFDQAGVVSIALEGALKVGEKVGYFLPSEYIEEEVSSLEVNKSQVENATAGQRVGYKTSRTRDELKVGMSVYIVRDLQNEPPE